MPRKVDFVATSNDPKCPWQADSAELSAVLGKVYSPIRGVRNPREGRSFADFPSVLVIEITGYTLPPCDGLVPLHNSYDFRAEPRRRVSPLGKAYRRPFFTVLKAIGENNGHRGLQLRDIYFVSPTESADTVFPGSRVHLKERDAHQVIRKPLK